MERLKEVSSRGQPYEQSHASQRLAAEISYKERVLGVIITRCENVQAVHSYNEDGRI